MKVKMRSFVLKNRAHFIAWFLFIFYELTIVGTTYRELGKFGDYFIHYAYNIAFFYFHAYLTLPYVSNSKGPKYLIFMITIVTEIFLYIIVIFVIDNLSAEFQEFTGIGHVSFDRSFIFKSSWRALYFIGFSTGYYFLITFLKERERTIALEKQRLHQIIERQKMEQELGNAQNAYLRAQINPHFLFNTLNFIYNKSRKSAPIAADAILTLSAMMRYAVESSEEKGYIIIEEEIEQVHHLIHLHKLRQNQQLYFNIEVQEEVRNLRIIPLVLITLTENIFKHGNLSLAHHPAVLKIYIDNDTLFIETDNLINAIHNPNGLSKGLENIQRRLTHNYGEHAHFVYTTDAKNHFKTQVQIKLNAFAWPLTALDSTDK